MPGETSQEEGYEHRLGEMLSRFPPIDPEARRRLLQIYESIEVSPLQESA